MASRLIQPFVATAIFVPAAYVLLNNVKVNGNAISAAASSLSPKARAVPPAAASTNAAVADAMLELAGAALTVKTGPVTDCPKIEIVMGPVVAPYGTNTSRSVVVAWTTVAAAPLKSTATSEMRVLNAAPLMLTS